MKVIDLLNKIANGEELPRKIQVYNNKYRLLDNRTYHSIDHEGSLGQNYSLDGMLNEEVEIIEDTPKEDKLIEPITIYTDDNGYSYYIYNKYGTKCSLSTHDKVIVDKINEIIDRLNGEDNE